MKVKVKSKQLPDGSQETIIYEGSKDFFPGKQLKNIRSTKIELDNEAAANIELRVDLTEVDVDGDAKVFVTSKEGVLGQVHSIKFVDGTEDVYV